jgi:hypothetical protein
MSVDRHVHKGGQPVDETGKKISPLWIRGRSRLSRQAKNAVENRARHVDERGPRIVEKPPTVTFIPVAHRIVKRQADPDGRGGPAQPSGVRSLQAGRSMLMYTKIQVVFDPEDNEFCAS